MSRNPNPTLVDLFRRWPEFLQAFSSLGSEPGQPRVQWTKEQIEKCLEWGVGDDWKDLRIDLLPSRVMTRLSIAIPMDENPMFTLQRLADKWWTLNWVLQTSKPQG